MASIGAIAARRDGALKRLRESMDRLSDRHGLERVQLTEWNRDPAYLEAERLDQLATWLEGFDKAGEANQVETAKAETAETNPAADYHRHTIGELKEMAQERHIDLSGMKTKAEIVDAFLAADGVSEDEQAGMDGESEA